MCTSAFLQTTLNFCMTLFYVCVLLREQCVHVLTMYTFFWCVCMHVCMYIRMHVCKFVCMHVCMYVRMDAWMHTRIYVCIHVCMYVRMHAWMHL